jgi:hypothetical protein
MTARDGRAARLTAALADRHRIDRELGASGMTTVHQPPSCATALR